MTPSSLHGIFAGLTQAKQSSNTASLQSTAEASPEEVAQNTSSPASSGQIAVDIYELDNYYIIRAPIAGVKLSDLDIEIDGKIITITGTRSLGDDTSPPSYLVQECFWGEFSRSITLPVSIDPKKVKATFSKDSILKILVPREEKAVKIVRINEG